MNTSRTAADVAIIGGGLHGCSAALHLGLAGFDSIVIEKDYVGRHASGVNVRGWSPGFQPCSPPERII